MDRILIIFNIPPSFGSSDLRRFFTDFVEAEKFVCFHYKRRPECKLKDFDRSTVIDVASSSSSTNQFNCCPAKIKEDLAQQFTDRYNDTHWTDEKGVDLDFKCFITTGSEESHWTGLDESRPPGVLPRGNVGTCTKFLLDSIQACKLPPSVIKRLKLNFHERRRRAYATVPLTYTKPQKHKSFYTPSTEAVTIPKIDIANSSKTADWSESEPVPGSSKSEKVSKSKYKSKTKDDPDSDREQGDDDDAVTSGEEEEWDRHRTLHDDVSARRVLSHPDDIEYQEGTKERRYEERMEVTWEKGGSGLVFYTDEQFWRETGQEDSDEPDDWDVDMEGYDVDGGGDHDNRNFMDMHRNTELEEGRQTTSAFRKRSEPPIGDFEKHTLGVGRKLMEKQGWKDGSGLGSKLAGISKPISARGGSSRAGLGFKGGQVSYPKAKRTQCQHLRPKSIGAVPKFHISTVFDANDTSDQ